MKKFILPLLVLGFVSSAFAGNCGSCATDKPQAPACQCGAKSADECKKHCGDKCDCTKQKCDAPKPEPKK